MVSLRYNEKHILYLETNLILKKAIIKKNLVYEKHHFLYFILLLLINMHQLLLSFYRLSIYCIKTFGQQLEEIFAV